MTAKSPGDEGILGRLRAVLPETANLPALALLFLISLLLLTKIFTSDFGTHIALGRETVRTWSIPDKEFLNYPSLGRHNPNAEWGFQALLYLVYRAGGFYGVSALCWAVVFGIYLLMFRSAVLRGANPYVAVLAIFAFSGFLRIRIQPRPEIFTYLFISLTIFLLCEYYFGKRKWLIYFFPPMIVAWANMHPTYLMAFILCGAFFVDGLARAAWNREFQWARLRTWVFPPVIVGALGLVLSGLNPNGYDVLLAPLVFLSRQKEQSHVLISISELTPVKGTGMYVYYKAAAAFAAVSLLLGAVGRRIYILDLFLYVISFKGAYEASRAVSMMGIFLAPGAALHVTGFLGRIGERLAPKAGPPPREPAREGGRKAGRPGRKGQEVSKPAEKPHRARAWARRGIAAAIGAAVIAFGIVTLSFTFGQLQYGVGMTEHKFSFAAADFLRKNPIPGKMFNFFDIGGFLDWQLYPHALTFIDGRTYNRDVFMQHQMVTSAMGGWNDVLAKYGITHIVTKTMDSSGMILPLIDALNNDPNWALVFADGLFVVYARNVPETQEIIRRFNIPKAAIARQIIWESYHYMYLGISPVMAYQNMSNMYMLMGDRPSAVRMLRQAVQESGGDPFLRSRLAQLEGGGGPRP